MAGRRVAHTIGRALRETGQAMNVLGYQAADEMAFKEPFTRHRTVMSIYDKVPSVASGCFVAPCASVIGDVSVGEEASVWYGAVVRGDFNKVTIGPGTNVQDLAVVKATEGSEAAIGSQVTIGHSAILIGCTVGDQSLIGIKSIVSEGATVESMAMVAPGAVVPSGTTVVSKQLWGGSPAKYIRDLTKDELAQLERQATAYSELALTH